MTCFIFSLPCFGKSGLYKMIPGLIKESSPTAESSTGSYRRIFFYTPILEKITKKRCYFTRVKGLQRRDTTSPRWRDCRGGTPHHPGEGIAEEGHYVADRRERHGPDLQSRNTATWSRPAIPEHRSYMVPSGNALRLFPLLSLPYHHPTRPHYIQ